MAALKPNVKIYIVQSVACFDTPSQVVDAVQKEFGLKVTRQQVESYDPTKASGKDLSQKWVDLFHVTRERFQCEIASIPIANKAWRLRVLDRMATSTEMMKNYGMTAQLLEQAAKEMGGTYTSKLKVESTGKGGGPVQTQSTSLTADEAAGIYRKMMD